MLRGLTSSFRTRGDRRPRQAIIGLPPASRPVMADPFIGLAGAFSCARFNSCALKFDGGVEGHAGRSGNGEADSGAILLPGRSKPARSSRYQARPVEANDRGPRTGLVRTENRLVRERAFYRRYMVFSNHGTPLNLSAGERRACSTHRHDPDLSGLFSLPVRVRQHPKGDLSESSKHFLNTSFSRTHFRGDDVCKSASIQFTAAPSQRSQ